MTALKHIDEAGLQRSSYLDWLRVFATGAMLFFHSGRFFDRWDWHVKNGEFDPGFTLLSEFILLWLMPLFFAMSGMSVSLSWKGGNLKRYSRSKFRRLLIPLVFGIFIVVPPQVYLERLTQGGFDGSFVQFIPRYFDGLYLFGGNFAWMGLHLWYLLVLFLFSFMAYPVFSYLRSGAGVMSRLDSLYKKFPVLFVMIIPVALLAYFEMYMNPEGAGVRYAGGWNTFTYLLYFIYGFTVFTSAPAGEWFTKYRFPVLGCAVLVSAVYLTGTVLMPDPHYGTTAYAGVMALRSLSGYLWLMAFPGIFMTYLNSSNAFLEYSNEAVLPFYILHQTVILIIGYYIVQLPLSPLVKYGIIVPASFAGIMVIYHFMVRPLRVLRFFFGMK